MRVFIPFLPCPSASPPLSSPGGIDPDSARLDSSLLQSFKVQGARRGGSVGGLEVGFLGDDSTVRFYLVCLIMIIDLLEGIKW